MSGLVGYGSSDEEEEIGDDRVTAETKRAPVAPDKLEHVSRNLRSPKSTVAAHNTNAPNISNAHIIEGPIAGPARGSAVDLEDIAHQIPGDQDYESNRTAIMNLTLPPVPNFDIPGSPPGSPDPSVADKLAQFAKLKKQGVHFNERLASSTAIKDPNLFAKLMDSFGVSEGNQYATTLPTSIWDPASFPSWAYKEELAKAQVEANQRKRQTGTQHAKLADTFVPATNSR